MALTFLFGSGADSDCSEYLPSGDKFSKVLLDNEYQNIKNALYSSSKNNIFSHSYILHYNSTKVFLQTIDEYREEAIKTFGKELVEYIVNEKSKKDDSDNSKVKAYCKYWYNITTSNESETSYDIDPMILEEFNKNKENICKFFHNHAVFFGTLDQKFNYLRKVDWSSEMKAVVNAYITVYLLMIDKLFFKNNTSLIEKEMKKRGHENIKSIKDITDFDMIFDLLSLGQKQFCENIEGSYYDIVRQSGIDCHVVTTNYTSIMEEVIGKEVVYLHGNLKWFEDLKRLTVYDCTQSLEELKKSNIIIPFIMISSGIKPVICTKQIEEFHKFLDYLNKSDRLCIMGYRFNSEDNHINSMIGDWLRKDNHKMIYFDFTDNNGLCFSNMSWAEEFKVKRIEEMNNSLDYDEKIIQIIINRETGRDYFKKFIELYKQGEDYE